ncbi:gfo/Idh/MocA family oxidoreductase [Paenibacillus psychroresistens]|uniref:Gfo/Idh/MocA family oxidoreductase n=1 Tax=Paenibacillus psychroresistens TaxID=1778678 RepID=A0A6B8RU68_9BACL|nr:Gfo/Idh/MocA family oxidoreductase [Paenibacillus psychroresistens]QGQ99477.1 gfo/Idh/MocA family oxidoreductase [Paenibacillus psychroresistens]
MAKHKIIVVGCGGMARAWVEYALQRPEDCEIVGLVDISEEHARRLAEKHGLQVPCFVDVAQAIQATGANLVFDITIPEAHLSVTLAAFKAGCDVMGEKPMGASAEEAKAMVSAADESGRFYAVMQNHRFNSGVRAFRSIIKDKHIGDLGFINADFFVGPHFGGFREAMKSPLILDMAIHTFDQARFISGADPVSVYCQEFNPPGSKFSGNAAAVCIFEMSDGSIFNYRGSWSSEGAPTSWASKWRVSGSKGTAIWEGPAAPYYELIKPAAGPVFENEFDRFEPELLFMRSDAHFACLDEMFTALQEQRKAETDCADNIKSIQMVFGALESSSKGKKVQLR